MTDQTEKDFAAAKAAEDRYFQLVEKLEEIEKKMRHLSKDSGTLYLTDYCIDIENTLDGGLTEDDGEAYWELMIAQASAAAGYHAEEYGFSINDHFDRPIF